MSRLQMALVALLVVLLAIFPLLAGEYFVNLASQVLIAAVFASSLNLLVGYAGLTSLGHASFLGISAYTSAWLAAKLGLGHAVTAPAALLVTTMMGMVFGWIAVAGGTAKPDAIRAVLSSGLLHGLLTDERTASTLLGPQSRK